jgi:AraC-like DNA-binding protein
MHTAILPIEGEDHDLPLVDRVIAFVEDHFASPISLRHVADAFGYSACHLTTTFRQATGTPLTAWIVQRRILAAKELLSEGEMNVAETCEAVGFTDLCYFTRQFARHVGTTPGRFRAACRAGRRSGQVVTERSRDLAIEEIMNGRRTQHSLIERVDLEIIPGLATTRPSKSRPGRKPVTPYTSDASAIAMSIGSERPSS